MGETLHGGLNRDVGPACKKDIEKIEGEVTQKGTSRDLHTTLQPQNRGDPGPILCCGPDFSFYTETSRETTCSCHFT